MQKLGIDKKTFFLVIAAFVFSILVRLIWVYQFSGYEQFKFHNQFMINTNDGYYWAEGARDILNGITKLSSDNSPIDTAASNLTAFFAKVLPFSFESIIFYMSAVLSSLVVVPIILIGRSIKDVRVGFIAALIASIAWSYYNRTMVGYYDTDMLNIFFPTLLLWSLILTINTKNEIYFILTAVEIILYRWWYPQSYSLEFSYWGLIFVYMLYRYYKKEDFKFLIYLLSFMMFAMMAIDGYIRFIIVVSLFILLKSKREVFEKYIYYIFGISILLFFISGGFNPIWRKLKGYVFKDDILVTKDFLELHFYTVMKTIREAGITDYTTFFNRISGHWVVFFLSLVGYIWLVIKKPVMLLGLPMLGLGFLALFGGLRFTIYAVPIMAFGVAFLIVKVSELLSEENKTLQYVLISVMSIAVLYPHIKHVIDYKVPTVFTKEEVKTLDKLKSIAKREDYVVSWWDYGYPIRYYTDIKTLADGAEHSGKVNFPVSYILTHPQTESAKMARLDVEYREKRYAIKLKDKNLSKELPSSNIAWMVKDYGFDDVNLFLKSLKDDSFKLPKKTRDIYLYLPNRMMGIYPTVTLFSNLDLQTGIQKARPFFYVSHGFRENQLVIDLGNGVGINKKTNTLIIGQNQVPIKKFAKVFYDKSGKLQKQVQTINEFGRVNVIFMPNYNRFLVVDDSVYNSTYIQLFVFENYDKKLFKPVIITPLAKIYKLKI